MNFDKFKDTRASEKLSVKKGTKKKAITKEPPVGTIEEPKTLTLLHLATRGGHTAVEDLIREYMLRK